MNKKRAIFMLFKNFQTRCYSFYFNIMMIKIIIVAMMIIYNIIIIIDNI